MKNVTILSIILLVFTSCSISSLKKNRSKNTALFNGDNLKGWTAYGTEKWYVENGVLFGENGKKQGFGYLKTTKDYKNFELTFDFKLSKKGNSGVFIHANIDSNAKVDGWQIEIGPPGHKIGGIYKYTKGWLVIPEIEKDKLIKQEDWNTMKILVKDNQITSWLNHVQMATCTDETLAEQIGGIALQIHDGKETKIAWRSIELIELK